MKLVNRSGLLTLAVMSILLPLWLVVLRDTLFGIRGWETLVYMFTYAPAVFVICWILFGLLIARDDVEQTKSIGSIDSLMLIGLYVSVFLHGFFLVDGDLSAGTLDHSVATKYIDQSNGVSNGNSEFFFLSSCLLIFLCFILFTYELVSKRTLTLGKKQ